MLTGHPMIIPAAVFPPVVSQTPLQPAVQHLQHTIGMPLPEGRCCIPPLGELQQEPNYALHKPRIFCLNSTPNSRPLSLGGPSSVWAW